MKLFDKKTVRRNRYTLLSLVVILGMFLILNIFYNLDGVVRSNTTVKGESGSMGSAKIGGEFVLTDHNGNVFTQENLLGKYSLVFFGFTFCPDVCPTTLSMLTNVMQNLPAEQAQTLQPVFVTIDPARDTQEVMKDYVTAFDSRVVGLTGTDEQIKDIAKKYLVYYARVKGGDDENYVMTHSGYIYLMGPDGKYLKHYRHTDSVDDVTTSLKQILHK